MPPLATPVQMLRVHPQLAELLKGAQPRTTCFQQRFAHDEVRDASASTDLDIESDAPVQQCRTRGPGTGVGDAEVRRRRREARLLTGGEVDLTRLDAAAQEMRERTQRERDPGETRMASTTRRVQREAPRVRQPPRERLRRLLRPLTAEVGLI